MAPQKAHSLVVAAEGCKHCNAAEAVRVAGSEALVDRKLVVVLAAAEHTQRRSADQMVAAVLKVLLLSKGLLSTQTSCKRNGADVLKETQRLLCQAQQD